VVINTDRCSADDVLVRAASHLGYYGRGYERLVDVLIGGEYGSEGKGHIAAYLAPEYDVLIRVGGPNAGHTVFGDPPYTHHQLPSGTLRSESAQLVIGPEHPLMLRNYCEIADCEVTIRDSQSISGCNHNRKRQEV
jgi:adenylosuccinate synthase